MQRTLDFLTKRPKLNSLKCPVCLLNLSNYESFERNYHIQLCEGNKNGIEIELRHKTIKKQIDEIQTESGASIHEAIVIDEEEIEILAPVLKHSPKKLEKVPKVNKVTKVTKTSNVPKVVKPRPIAPYFKTLTFNLVIENRPFRVSVDGFNYSYKHQINHFFLSHFHSDHYIGLTKKWFLENSEAKIYCSRITRDLIIEKINKNFNDSIIEINDFEIIYSNENEFIKVLILNANHCPGGSIYLFIHYLIENGTEIKRKVILHTGDFRVSKEMLKFLKDFKFNEIYLDTTYLDPLYLFIEQNSLVNKTCSFLKNFTESNVKNSILNYFSNNDNSKKWVLLIGTYSIGKENLYLKLSDFLNTKILISIEKFKILKAFLSVNNLINKFIIFDLNNKKFKNKHYYEVDELKIYNLDYINNHSDLNSLIHLLPISKLSDNLFLTKFYNNKKIIKIKPTGWCFRQFSKVKPTPLINEEDKINYLDFIFNETEINNDEFNRILNDMIKFKNEIFLPYSEHSNFKELSIFGSFLNWDKMIPTVSNHYDKNLIEFKEFKKWFKIWKDYKLDWDKIEDHYRYETTT